MMRISLGARVVGRESFVFPEACRSTLRALPARLSILLKTALRSFSPECWIDASAASTSS